MCQFWGFSCISNKLPGVTSGVALKSNITLSAGYTDNFELEWQLWKLLKLISACETRRYNPATENLGLDVQRTAIKWDLNVWIACPEALKWWRWGGNNWLLILYFKNECFNIYKASFSIMQSFGGCPLMVTFSSIGMVLSWIYGPFRFLVLQFLIVLVS